MRYVEDVPNHRNEFVISVDGGAFWSPIDEPKKLKRLFRRADYAGVWTMQEQPKEKEEGGKKVRQFSNAFTWNVMRGKLIQKNLGT